MVKHSGIVPRDERAALCTSNDLRLTNTRIKILHFFSHPYSPLVVIKCKVKRKDDIFCMSSERFGYLLTYRSWAIIFQLTQVTKKEKSRPRNSRYFRDGAAFPSFCFYFFFLILVHHQPLFGNGV